MRRKMKETGRLTANERHRGTDTERARDERHFNLIHYRGTKGNYL